MEARSSDPEVGDIIKLDPGMGLVESDKPRGVWYGVVVERMNDNIRSTSDPEYRGWLVQPLAANIMPVYIMSDFPFTIVSKASQR